MTKPTFVLFLDDEWTVWGDYYANLAAQLCGHLGIASDRCAGYSDPSIAYAKMVAKVGADSLDEVLVISDVAGTDWGTLLITIFKRHGAQPLFVFFSDLQPAVFPSGTLWVREKSRDVRRDAKRLSDVVREPNLADGIGREPWEMIANDHAASLAVGRTSVLKHRLVHIFLPLSVRLQTAAQLEAGGTESTSGGAHQVQQIWVEVEAALPGKREEAIRLLEEYGKASAEGISVEKGQAAMDHVARLRQCLTHMPLVPDQFRDFHKWLIAFDDELDKLRGEV